MSKRSPFWQAFSTTTPLGYAVEGHFHTEPGPNYGTLRVTRVDKPLPKPYLSPGLPEPSYLSMKPDAACDRQAIMPPHGLAAGGHPLSSATASKKDEQAGASWCLADAVNLLADATDARLVERLDGTLVAFWPLFDAHGALVEVVPRTRDLPVAVNTSWRPLSALIRAARHAGIEEAVRRQRAVFVFSLAGYDNARVVAYPFAIRLVVHSVLRGSGRTLGTFKQVQGWARQYGLDLPETRAELDLPGNIESFVSRLNDAVGQRDATGQAPIGRRLDGGCVVWVSTRQGARLLDVLPDQGPGGVLAMSLFDTLARIADHDAVPTLDAALQQMSRLSGDTPRAEKLEMFWRYWANAYPLAFPTQPADRIAG
jgi:hypothetical protein